MAVDLTAPVVAGRRGAKQDAPLPEIVLAAKQRLTRALAAGEVVRWSDVAIDADHSAVRARRQMEQMFRSAVLVG